MNPKCPECGSSYADRDTCPSCGHALVSATSRIVMPMVMLGVGVVMMAVIAYLSLMSLMKTP